MHTSTRLLSIFALALTAMAPLALTGCNTTPGSGQLETPSFSTLEIRTATGWSTYTPTSPAATVLPTRGRAVQVWFYAPLGAFSASLRTPDGVVTPLAESRGAQQPPEAGFYEMVRVNANTTPPLHTMYIRAPLTLSDPANYDVLIVHKSLNTNRTDSNPMVLSLRARPVFTVTVQVVGNGRVTSNPPGIQCGTAPSGQALTDCSHDFGTGTITLAPGSGNMSRFTGWGGNCNPSVQVCSLTLTGASAMSATAIFAASSAPPTATSCPAAPPVPGLRWIDLPACATGNIAGHPGITNPAVCDARGYFCCEPGPAGSNAPRCGGAGKIESTPDCLRHAPRGILRQPGGCYETDSP